MEEVVDQFAELLNRRTILHSTYNDSYARRNVTEIQSGFFLIFAAHLYSTI